MTPLTGGKGELLRRLAAMPFLDRLEMVAVSGWSRGAVYEAVKWLEDEGLAASVPHGTDLVPPTRRFHLTADGLHRLAQDEGMTLDDLLRSRPASARWRRVLLERLDSLAVVYRLASSIANLSHPIRFRWYRAMPMDAALALPDGRTLAIVRQGRTADRTGFAKRLWRLGEGPSCGGVQLLLSDEVRLRHARRLLARTSATALLALEREAAAATPDDPVWRLPSVNAAVDLRSALHRMRSGGPLPTEPPLVRASLPEDIDDSGAGRGVPEHLLPALIKPAEKRALDLLADWPWIALRDLAGLLGVSEQRASQLTTALEGFGLATRVPAAGRRLTLTDLGLTLLARRDRAAVGGAKKRWSPAPSDAGDVCEVAQLRRYPPAQLVVGKGQPCHAGEVAQLRRYLPTQLVIVEGQIYQVGEVVQLRRYLPAQLVPAEVQIFQVGEVAQLRRYLPAQLVVGKGQPCQAGEVAQLRRYLPTQLVIVEGQIYQVGEVVQLRRYLPAQLVPAEVQIFQVGEVGQLRRYLPAQLVPVEVQPCQVGEVAQLRRYLPTQLVPAEEKFGDAAVIVNDDAFPLANRHVAQPVIAVSPMRAAGGVIEGDQGFPVRFGRGLHHRRRGGGRRCGRGGGRRCGRGGGRRCGRGGGRRCGRGGGRRCGRGGGRRCGAWRWPQVWAWRWPQVWAWRWPQVWARRWPQVWARRWPQVWARRWPWAWATVRRFPL